MSKLRVADVTAKEVIDYYNALPTLLRPLVAACENNVALEPGELLTILQSFNLAVEEEEANHSTPTVH